MATTTTTLSSSSIADGRWLLDDLFDPIFIPNPPPPEDPSNPSDPDAAAALFHELYEKETDPDEEGYLSQTDEWKTAINDAMMSGLLQQTGACGTADATKEAAEFCNALVLDRYRRHAFTGVDPKPVKSRAELRVGSRSRTFPPVSALRKRRKRHALEPPIAPPVVNPLAQRSFHRGLQLRLQMSQQHQQHQQQLPAMPRSGNEVLAKNVRSALRQPRRRSRDGKVPVPAMSSKVAEKGSKNKEKGKTPKVRFASPTVHVFDNVENGEASSVRASGQRYPTGSGL